MSRSREQPRAHIPSWPERALSSRAPAKPWAPPDRVVAPPSRREPPCAWAAGTVMCATHRAKCRDALEGKGPRRRPQQRLDMRLEEVAEAVGGGYCWLQMPLRLEAGICRRQDNGWA